MSDVWWPEGTNDPAFQVQRQPYGAITGGDYVRARSGGITTLPQTALRYFTQVKGWNAIANKALVSARPYDYSTMEVLWGWPKDLGTWLEVALVRSSFGRPVTVNDGQTVFRATREAMMVTFSEDGESINGPIIYDRPIPGGRWYYYTVFFKTTPLDWVPGFSMGSPLPKNYGHAEHLWNNLPPWYQFQDDQQRADDGHLRQFLKIFGFELDLTREFVEQWQHLYHIDFTPRRLLIQLGQNFDVPYESGLGDIRYRGIVGNIAQLYAERGTRNGLEHLIEASSQYECDVSRGGNLMLLPEDSEFLGGTGNWAATNEDMVLPDEWGTVNMYTETVFRSADTTVIPPPVDAGRGVLEITPVTVMPDPPWGAPPTTAGGALADLVAYCGVGTTYESGAVNDDGTYEVATKELIPLYSGIAVQPGVLYGCSLWIRAHFPTVTTLGLLWYGSGGKYEDYLDFVEATPAIPTTDIWTEFTVQAVAPEPPTPGSYLIPYVRVSGVNYNHSIYLAGAMVYALGSSGTVTAFAPDRYLTLGDPAEAIGSPPKPGDAAFKGYLLGEG